MARSLNELRKMSDADLIAEHDAIATNTQTGLDYYTRELQRRDIDKSNHEMMKLTAAMARMTRRIEILTWVAATAAVISIVAAFA